MPHLRTAKQHCDQDITRAIALRTHANTLPAGGVKDDILRASWMMAVGASDAYFSDVYADLVARTLRAKELEPNVNIPDRLSNLKVPAVTLIREARGGWRWRMAARELIENEHVLSLEKIRQLLGQFFRKGYKILSVETIAEWLQHADAKSRLFGLTGARYRALTPQARGKAKKDAFEQFDECYTAIFQRRHDCIHNCDRPKTALQRINESVVKKRIEDVSFLIERCHDALTAEFPIYLKNLGFSGAVRAQVLA